MSSARERTLAHVQRLVAAAAVVGVVPTCKKESKIDPPLPEVDAASSATANVEPAPTVPPVATPDPSATAPSTLDSARFADAGGPTGKKKKDGGVAPPPTHGYVVVDPMPPPTRLPKNTKAP
jgi:hypothetical protein